MEIPFPIRAEVRANLDIYLDAVKHSNDDLLIVLDGKEGSGKSVLARQLGWYCANYLGVDFGVENIHFDLQSYIDFSLDSPKFSINILDEARNVLNRKNSMSSTNKKFTNYMSECRSKNQIHIICLPAFHDLDTYIALWRMKFLLHLNKRFVLSENTESGYELLRGEYKMYMNDSYLQGKYENKYFYPTKYETYGYFNNYEIIDLDDYDKKKAIYTIDKYHSSAEKEKESKIEEMWKERAIKLINAHSERGVPESSIVEMIGFSKDNWTKFKYRHKDKLLEINKDKDKGQLIHISNINK